MFNFILMTDILIISSETALMMWKDPVDDSSTLGMVRACFLTAPTPFAGFQLDLNIQTIQFTSFLYPFSSASIHSLWIYTDAFYSEESLAKDLDMKVTLLCPSSYQDDESEHGLIKSRWCAYPWGSLSITANDILRQVATQLHPRLKFSRPSCTCTLRIPSASDMKAGRNMQIMNTLVSYGHAVFIHW